MAQKRHASPTALEADPVRAAKLRKPQRTGVPHARPQTASQFTTLADLARSVVKPPNEYEYSKITKQQLRMLDLHPARDRNDSIVCELRTVSFTELHKHPYNALSYCWGASEPTQEISMRIPGQKQSKFVDAVDKVMIQRQGNKSQGRSHGASLKYKKPWQKKFYVTQNLETALRYFRNDAEAVTIWVDAICINQDDEKEKGQQVSRMAEIFHRADAVRVWLGESDFNTEGVVKFAKAILDLQALEKFVSGPQASARPWYQLSQLMRREWFTRRWVVQELALAKEAYLHVGDEDLHWDDFAEAVALFAQEADRIESLFESSPEYSKKRIGKVRASGAFSIIQMTNNLFRWSGNEVNARPGEGDAERLTPLEELVSHLVMFDARDPRDTIFAMLSLAKDIPSVFDPGSTADRRPSPATFTQPEPLLVADYTSNTLEVFKNFVAFCTMSGSLDIICRHWAPNELPIKLSPPERLELLRNSNNRPKPIEVELPSWIPLLRDSAFSPPFKSLSGTRRAADDLVGLPSQRRYDAARGTKAAVWFGEVDVEEVHRDGKAKNNLYAIDIPQWTTQNYKVSSLETLQRGRKRRSDGCLYVLGFKTGRICKLSGRLQDGTISKEALDYCGWTSEMEDDSSPPDTIWRTFVADRDKQGNNPPLWYRRALLTCVALRNHNDDVHPHNVRDEMKSVPMHEFLDRLEAVLWNKKLMALESKNKDERFGIAPHKAEVDDIICVLLGCSVPVVLREIVSSEGTYYQFIGEAYVYNLMAGEALRQHGSLSDEELQQLDDCIEFRLR